MIKVKLLIDVNVLRETGKKRVLKLKRGTLGYFSVEDNTELFHAPVKSILNVPVARKYLQEV